MRLQSFITGAAALALAVTAAVTIAAQENPKLRNPLALVEEGPALWKANIETSKGAFVIEVHRDWAPRGADRFFNLVKNGFYTDVRFFRVIPGFMAQFGIHGTPDVAKVWQTSRINDDPVKQSNRRGYVTFATAGPNTRTTQLFVNFGDNAALDKQGFAPFGRIDEKGMAIVDKIYGGYGEGAPRGRGPDQGRLQAEGNAYLAKDFPRLDYIKSATISQ